MATESEIDVIVDGVRDNFRTFGGGKFNPGNPVSFALANRDLQFAAGVSVRDVVEFIITALGEPKAGPPDYSKYGGIVPGLYWVRYKYATHPMWTVMEIYDYAMTGVLYAKELGRKDAVTDLTLLEFGSRVEEPKP